MKEPHIKILLEDGNSTWVTVVPFYRSVPVSDGIIMAAGGAAALFIANLARDADVLDERFRDAD